MAKQKKNKTLENEQQLKAIEESVKLAKTVLKPSVNAAAIIAEYTAPFGKQNMLALVNSLSDSIDKVIDGNLNTCEAMLVSQAHALQSLFMDLSRRAIKQEYLSNFETYLKLALKAQSQCRSTLETIAMIKNPPIIYAKQTNIAQGHQQINNGTMAQEPIATTRAGKIKSDQNELLETQNEQRLEQRTSNTTSGSYQEVEAMETRDRAKD